MLKEVLETSWSAFGFLRVTLFNLEGIRPKGGGEPGEWGFSSAGRAPALQAGGQRFEPANLHQTGL